LGLPAHIAGRAMTAGHKGELPTLLQFETKLNTISLFRRKVLPVLLNGVAFCLPLTFLLIILLKIPAFRPVRSFRPYLWLFIVFLAALPVALHLASQLPLTGIPSFVGATFAIAFFLTLLSGLIHHLQQGRIRTAQLPAVITV